MAGPIQAQPLPERPGQGFERVMREFQVGGEPLRDDEADLVPALEALRRVHMDALGDRSSPRVWRMWNLRLIG